MESESSKTIKPRFSRFKNWILLSFIILIFASYINWQIDKDEIKEEYTINIDLKDIFTKLDLDDDKLLTFTEFLNIVKYDLTSFRIYMSSTAQNYAVQNAPDIIINPEDEVITIESKFQPLDINSLSKDITPDAIQNQNHAFKGVFDWNKQEAERWKNFAAKHFSAFLPSADQKLKPGTTWWIIPSSLNERINHLSSARYYPPELATQYHSIHALLSMLHIHPFLHSRFGPQGTVAVIRGISINLLDIVFRMHAEFQLNKPPNYPFWFTPSQFKGRILINRNSSSVFYFNMEVPSDRKLNVDMEWLNGPQETDGMEVDLGFIPQLQLISTGPSIKLNNINSNEIFIHGPSDYEASISNIEWSEEIDMEDALKIIEQTMYPFKQITYYNFTEAYIRAKNENKLIHAILLWGALDDQSC